MNILGAHIDSPRLDVKQNPCTSRTGSSYSTRITTAALKLPVGGHAACAARRGRENRRRFGAGQHRRRRGRPGVLRDRPVAPSGPGADGEDGRQSGRGRGPRRARGQPSSAGCGREAAEDKPKDPAKAFVLQLLAEKYGIAEEDFLSAELEAVPAGRAPRGGSRPQHGHRLRAGRPRVRLHLARSSAGARGPGSQPPRRTAPHRARRQRGDRQRGRNRHGLAVLRERGRGDHGACRRRRAASPEARPGELAHALLRRVRRVRSGVRERLRDEEHRSFSDAASCSTNTPARVEKRQQRRFGRVRRRRAPRDG